MLPRRPAAPPLLKSPGSGGIITSLREENRLKTGDPKAGDFSRYQRPPYGSAGSAKAFSRLRRRISGVLVIPWNT